MQPLVTTALLEKEVALSKPICGDSATLIHELSQSLYRASGRKKLVSVLRVKEFILGQKCFSIASVSFCRIFLGLNIFFIHVFQTLNVSLKVLIYFLVLDKAKN